METTDALPVALGPVKTPRRTVAKRKVRAWMIQTGRTYASLAAELKVSPGHLQTVMYGLKGCSLDLASRWARLSKLPIWTFVELRNPHRRRRG